MRPAYVITTCGRTKFPGPAPAIDFYLGSFVKKQGKAASALNPSKGRLILSNKYGFMRPDFIVPGPYDSHWGYPDTLGDDELLAQVASLGLRPGDWVVNLGAFEYARQTRRLFPDYVRVMWPPQHLPSRSMGYQGRLYSQLELLGKLPGICQRECWVESATVPS